MSKNHSPNTSTHNASTRTASTDNQTLSQALRRLLGYLKGALPRLIFGFVTALAGSVVALLIPQVLHTLVDNVLHKDGAAKDVWFAAVVILLLGVIQAFLIYLRRVLVIMPAMGVENDMRKALFTQLEKLPVPFHDRWASGQLLQRSMGDLSLVRRWLAFGAIFLLTSILTVVVGTILLFTINWILALIFLAAAIPVSIRAFQFRKTFGAASRLSQDQAGDLATSVEESVHGIRVLKAFGRGSHALGAFSKQAKALQNTELYKARTLGFFLNTVISLPEVALGISLIVGVLLVNASQLSIGALVAFFATAVVMSGPVEDIGMLLGMTLTTKTALDRHFEVMDEVDPITEPEHPVTPHDPHGHLQFRDLVFRYPDSKQDQAPILNGINLDIEPGETMALVGVTGSGKSTLLNLVPRLFDVSEGSISIDGTDIREFMLEDLRTLVSVAFEDPVLFSTSVRDNALMGLPDGWDPAQDLSPQQKSAHEAALTKALQVSQAQFSYDLPQGVDTKIGEEGLSLSGGQRQRLALARAIAAKPQVLVLDDPLSALDVRTEETVTQALREVLAETTTLIVAHRPSTVMLADRVALLQDGRISAVGTHSELLASNDHYRFVIASLDQEHGDPDRVERMEQERLEQEQVGQERADVDNARVDNAEVINADVTDVEERV